MLSAYIFFMVVGGCLLALSFFGDFLDGDVDTDGALALDGDIDAAVDGFDFTKLFSLRAAVYASFGFGASGALLHWIWGGDSPVLTGVLAGGMGIASGALIGTVFGYLKRSESGTIAGEDALIGLRGEVRMAIAYGDTGTVRIESGQRQFRIRARLDELEEPGTSLEPGDPVVVVDVKQGVAVVAPVDMKLLED